MSEIDDPLRPAGIVWPILFAVIFWGLITFCIKGCEAGELDFMSINNPTLSNDQKIAALVGYAIIDYNWSVDHIVKKPRKWRELNPLLGKHPNREKLVAFGIVGVLAAYLASRSDSIIAKITVDSIIASEAQNIYENDYRRNRKNIPIVISYNFAF